MPVSLTRIEFFAAPSKSVALVARYPPRWLLNTVLFLIVVEGSGTMPYVGFLVKRTLAGVFARHWIRMFVDADAGRPPRLRSVLGAFARPSDEVWPLVLCALAPFFVGIVALGVFGQGRAPLQFLFGRPGDRPLPDQAHWLIFRSRCRSSARCSRSF